MLEIDIELLTDFLKRKKEILCEFFMSFHSGETIEDMYKEEETIDNFETFKKNYLEERFDLIEKLEIDLFDKLKGFGLEYDYETDYDHNFLGLKGNFFLKHRKKDNILYNFKKLNKILGGRLDSQYISNEGILTYRIYELNQGIVKNELPISRFIISLDLQFSEVKYE